MKYNLWGKESIKTYTRRGNSRIFEHFSWLLVMLRECLKPLGPVRVMAPTGPVFFLQILHDTKIGCIRLVRAGAKKYQFTKKKVRNKVNVRLTFFLKLAFLQCGVFS